MAEEKKSGGVALFCDREGVIVCVLHDDLALAGEMVQGCALTLVAGRAGWNGGHFWLIE